MFVVDGAKSGEAEKSKVLALQRLDKDWSSYGHTIYTDGWVKDGTKMIGGGILSITGHSSDPTNHHSYATPAGTWCSSIQAKMKAMKKVPPINQIEESPMKVRFVSDSQSVLLRIASLQHAVPLIALMMVTS